MKIRMSWLPRAFRREAPPPEAAEEVLSPAALETAAQEEIRSAGIQSARRVAESIEIAKTDLSKYLLSGSSDTVRTPLTPEDIQWIVGEMEQMQAMLQSVHNDEDVSELDTTLSQAFVNTLPFFFRFGEKAHWQSALKELKQAISMRIGDETQVKFSNVDLLILHCRAKELYYDWNLYLNEQQLTALREERKELVLHDAPETLINDVVSRIDTAVNNAELYRTKRSSNAVKMEDLKEHKRLHEEHLLTHGEVNISIDQIIAENTGLMLGISEETVADARIVQEMIARRDAVNAVIRQQLTDCAPERSAASIRMTETETETLAAEPREVLLAGQ